MLIVVLEFKSSQLIKRTIREDLLVSFSFDLIHAVDHVPVQHFFGLHFESIDESTDRDYKVSLANWGLEALRSEGKVRLRPEEHVFLLKSNEVLVNSLIEQLYLVKVLRTQQNWVLIGHHIIVKSL